MPDEPDRTKSETMKPLTAGGHDPYELLTDMMNCCSAVFYSSVRAHKWDGSRGAIVGTMLHNCPDKTYEWLKYYLDDYSARLKEHGYEEDPDLYQEGVVFMANVVQSAMDEEE